jgi:hypothetical protein
VSDWLFKITNALGVIVIAGVAATISLSARL